MASHPFYLPKGSINLSKADKSGGGGGGVELEMAVQNGRYEQMEITFGRSINLNS